MCIFMRIYVVSMYFVHNAIFFFVMKIEVILEQAMKVQRVSKSIALLFLQPRRKMGWVVNATPRPLYPPERPKYP
jgi:hypothetical protein